MGYGDMNDATRVTRHYKVSYQSTCDLEVLLSVYLSLTRPYRQCVSG